MKKLGLLIGLGVTVFVLVIVGIVLIVGYNGLLNKKESVDQNISQIAIRIETKDDTLSEMQAAITDLESYSLEVFNMVTAARAAFATAQNSGDIDQLDEANALLTEAYDSFVVIIEDNNLANAVPGYLTLIEEIHTTNSLLAQSKRDYNDAVYLYNTSIKRFPAVLYAKAFGFTAEYNYWGSLEDVA